MELDLGQTVETKNDRRGTVRYVGDVAGKDGTWVGIELFTATGKNDGSVQGDRYFQCAPLHGVFMRVHDIARIVSAPPPSTPTRKPQPAPAPKPAKSTAKATAPAVKGRPSSVGGAGAGGAGTASSRPPPVRPLSRPSGVGLTKAPLAQPRQPPAPSRRSTLSPSKPLQQPTPQQPPPPPRPSSIVSGRSSTQSPAQAKRLSINSASQPFSGLRSARKPSISTSSTPSAPARTASTVAAPSASTTRASKDSAAQQTLEIESRQLKKQLAEKDAALQEALPYRPKYEKTEGLVQKLSAKCQQFHQENTELRQTVKSLETDIEQKAKADLDNDDALELAVLDRELAEEQRDQALAELATAKEQIDELRLDLEIRREEASLITEDMSDEQKGAVILHQTMAERDRYREAILTLRDINHEMDQHHKAEVKELETQLEPVDGLRKENEQLKEDNAKLESVNTHLQEEIDGAADAEDMVEELRERADAYEEKINLQAIEIRDLEAVNEVNTETITEYVDHTAELQEDLGTKEKDLNDLLRELDEERQEKAELKNVIEKYHGALLETQSKMQQADTQKLMSEEEAKGVNDRFNEIMELNRSLRNARVNDTAKTINTELNKLSANEAREELSIMKHYLPESSNEYMNYSLRAYFRTKKIAFKANLISTLLATEDTSAAENPEKALTNMYRFDAVHHLEYIRAHGQYFVETVANSTLDQFRKAGHEYEDFAIVEATIERTLEAFKRDELNFKDIAEAIRGTDKVMRGITIASRNILASRPENELLLYTSSIRSSLEHIQASLGAVKRLAQLVDDTNDEDSEFDTIVERVVKPARAATETAALVAKLSQVLSNLQNDGLYPQYPAGPQELAEQCDELVQQAGRTHEFAESVATSLLGGSDGDDNSITVSMLINAIESGLKTFFPQVIDVSLKSLRTKVSYWHEYASILMNTVEIERLPAPWVVRAQELEAGKKRAIDAEKRLQVLITEHQSTLIQIREREEIIDTKNVEIEHLRAKHKEAVTKTGKIEQLHQDIRDMKHELDIHKREVELQKEEITQLRENTQHAPQATPAVVPAQSAEQTSAAHAEQQKTESSLSSTFVTLVRALKTENNWLRQRENTKLGHDLDVFSRIQRDKAAQAKTGFRYKQALAEEMLNMSFSVHDLVIEEATTRVNVLDSVELTEDSGADVKAPKAHMGRSRRAPLQLASKQTSLRWHGSLDFVEDWSFMDLSSVIEDYDTVKVLEGIMT